MIDLFPECYNKGIEENLSVNHLVEAAGSRVVREYKVTYTYNEHDLPVFMEIIHPLIEMKYALLLKIFYKEVELF